MKRREKRNLQRRNIVKCYKNLCHLHFCYFIIFFFNIFVWLGLDFMQIMLFHIFSPNKKNVLSSFLADIFILFLLFTFVFVSVVILSWFWVEALMFDFLSRLSMCHLHLIFHYKIDKFLILFTFMISLLCIFIFFSLLSFSFSFSTLFLFCVLCIVLSSVPSTFFSDWKLFVFLFCFLCFIFLSVFQCLSSSSF